jgi:dephospho-CoA kinase
LGLNEYSKDKVLNIQLENIAKVANEFSNSDIVLKNIKELENLEKQLNNKVYSRKCYDK